MAIEVVCFHCGEVSQIPEQWAGRQVLCRCGQRLVVPQEEPYPRKRAGPSNLASSPDFGLPEEVAQIDYFLEQFEILQQRGLVTPEAAQTVRSEYSERRTQLVREAEWEVRRVRAAELEKTAPQQAAAAWEYLLTLDPRRPEPYRRLAHLYERLGRLEEARGICEAGAIYDGALASQAEQLREREAQRQRLQLLEKALHQALEAGQEAAIIAACHGLLRADATHLTALETLARTYARQGRWGEAVAAFGDLLAAHPQHSARLVWEREQVHCRTVLAQRQVQQRAEERPPPARPRSSAAAKKRRAVPMNDGPGRVGSRSSCGNTPGTSSSDWASWR